MSEVTSSRKGSGRFSSGLTKVLAAKASELIDEAAPRIDFADIVAAADALTDEERRDLLSLTALMDRAGVTADGKQLSANGRHTLTLSEDQMFFTLSIKPPIGHGAAVTVEQVVASLRELDVSRGVELPAIQQAVKAAAAGEEVVDVVVVRGRPPQPGRDATIERFARRMAGGPLEPVSDRQLERVQNEYLLCEAGDRIVHRQPPTPGLPGQTADNQVLPPPEPADVVVEVGPNVRQEGDDYFAEVSGIVLFGPDARVEVRKALILTRDLTRGDKPVQFDGDVHVKAAVRSGAVVRATGDIVVDGPVEAAEVHSSGGDVTLRGGVVGRHAAVVSAERDVIARFVENATVFAGQQIRLDASSLHSRLVAGQSVLATEGKGQIAGGEVTAGERVEAKHLGTPGGVRTMVTVGLSIETLNQLRELDEATARLKQRRNTCEELIEQIERAVGDPKKLKPAEMATYVQLRQLRLGVDVEIRKRDEARRRLLTVAGESRAGQVIVLRELEHGIEVRIGNGTFEPPPQRGPVTIKFDERSQRIGLARRA